MNDVEQSWPKSTKSEVIVGRRWGKFGTKPTNPGQLQPEPRAEFDQGPTSGARIGPASATYRASVARAGGNMRISNGKMHLSNRGVP